MNGRPGVDDQHVFVGPEHVLRYLRLGTLVSASGARERRGRGQEVLRHGLTVLALLHIVDMNGLLETGSIWGCAQKKTTHRFGQEDCLVAQQHARGIQLPETHDTSLRLHHGGERPPRVVRNGRPEERWSWSAWGHWDRGEHQVRGKHPSRPVRHDAAWVFNPLQGRAYSVETHGGGIVRLGIRRQKASLQGTFGHPEELRDDGLARAGQEPIDGDLPWLQGPEERFFVGDVRCVPILAREVMQGPWVGGPEVRHVRVKRHFGHVASDTHPTTRRPASSSRGKELPSDVVHPTPGIEHEHEHVRPLAVTRS